MEAPGVRFQAPDSEQKEPEREQGPRPKTRKSNGRDRPARAELEPRVASRVSWQWYFLMREVLECEFRTGVELVGVRQFIQAGDPSSAMVELNYALAAEHAGKLDGNGSRVIQRQRLADTRRCWRRANLNTWPLDGTKPPKDWMVQNGEGHEHGQSAAEAFR